MNIIFSILAFYGSCGIKPIDPIPPIGTTSCQSVCICHADNNCYWEFLCQ